MNVTLKRIKRLIIQGNYLFTLKAENEIEASGLVIEDAEESGRERFYILISSKRAL